LQTRFGEVNDRDVFIAAVCATFRAAIGAANRCPESLPRHEALS